MPMYNLLESNECYSMASSSLQNYYKDERNAKENNNNSYRINNVKTTTNKSFQYKTKIMGSAPNGNNIFE